MAIETCPVCRISFAGTEQGDKHRKGTFQPKRRRCVPRFLLSALGLFPNDKDVFGTAEGNAAGVARAARLVEHQRARKAAGGTGKGDDS